jgi:Zn-dependent M28 family amino/carboxypeptidase
VFNDDFRSQGLAFEATEFDGRSDYEAFINNGISAGGLFTGAEGVKTAAQAATYGGAAGQPYDPCYHAACVTTDNVSMTGLGPDFRRRCARRADVRNDHLVGEWDGQGQSEGSVQSRARFSRPIRYSLASTCGLRRS